jgi:hypothetical protein
VIGWIAFAAALVFGIVLIGFCAYELVWKSKRLARDLAGLQRLSQDLLRARAELDAIAGRLQATARRGR